MDDDALIVLSLNAVVPRDAFRHGVSSTKGVFL